MNFRHLRCFIAVAEELHFGRAAERMHIEQSPLSRAIKKLESELGVLLLERTSHGTQLTWAGQVFLEDARRILLAIDQAKSNARSAATGFRGRLRIALSDGIAQSRLTALLALCREEAPDIEIRLFELPLSQQMKGLRADLYDVGFTLFDGSEPGIVAEPVWRDPLVVAIPARHPLLAHKNVVLQDVLNYPLVLCRPETCEGYSRQLERLLRSVDMEPQVVEQVSSHDLMLALVAAGYGVGFSSAAHVSTTRHTEVVARRLVAPPFLLSTFVLRPDTNPSEQLASFLRRVAHVGAMILPTY